MLADWSALVSNFSTARKCCSDPPAVNQTSSFMLGGPNMLVINAGFQSPGRAYKEVVCYQPVNNNKQDTTKKSFLFFIIEEQTLTIYKHEEHTF